MSVWFGRVGFWLVGKPDSEEGNGCYNEEKQAKSGSQIMTIYQEAVELTKRNQPLDYDARDEIE